MNFIQTVESAWQKNNSLLCVGLDPDRSKIPARLRGHKTPLFAFNQAIIDATADLVCAFKPQIAYYAAACAEQDLELTITYVHERYPGIPVILDAKRGDIGATAAQYAHEAFDRYQADAVTVNPYLGGDTLKPFLDRRDKGIIILCRTSNPGAKELQDLDVGGKKLYQIVASKAASQWNYNGNVLLVVAATYPQELGEIRSLVGEMPLLVPGIGAQGGEVKSAVLNGKSKNGQGMIINSSRGIIYASEKDNFVEAARAAAIALRDEINLYR
jgi:orotidine-5'-phosphate decarboxylase